MSAGTLYIRDSRTGATHEVPIRHNAIWASDLARIQDPSGQTPNGLRVVDETLRYVSPRLSQITFLDAGNGRLYYRGYEIVNIIGRKTYEEACYCLIWGDFPSSAEAAQFRHELFSAGGRPPRILFDVIEKIP